LAAEDRLALARIEAGRERYQEAVTHVREARAEAPTSVRLLLEEASYLGAMGRLEEALRHYAEAAALDPDGDADFQAAVLILQSGADPERAEALLVKALARSPILVLDALYDVSGTFDALRGRPTFEAAVGEAQRAMGEA
jgi:tetratricopeptide (TPR) repeat protein